MEIVWALLLFASAVVLDFVLLVRASRYKRALRVAERNVVVLTADVEVLNTLRVAYEEQVKDFQATVKQYQLTMEQVGKQLKAAGLGIESRDLMLQQQSIALQDINRVIHDLYTLFVADEDRDLLNDAWRAWHARNYKNVPVLDL